MLDGCKSDKSKKVIGVSDSATTQHIEASINANNIHLDNQSEFCCQDLFFASGFQIQASLSPPAADMPACGLSAVYFS